MSDDTIGLHMEDDSYTVSYRAEFDIRDGFAALAQRCGWDVETEHVVPGWGRPDLYITSGSTRFAVEVKVDLTTPSKCRKGIQQAASYKRAMPEISDVILTAPRIDFKAMAEYEQHYPEVWVLGTGKFMEMLSHHAATSRERHIVALARFRAAERDVELRRRVLSDLSQGEGSPIGAQADVHSGPIPVFPSLPPPG